MKLHSDLIVFDDWKLNYFTNSAKLGLDWLSMLSHEYEFENINISLLVLWYYIAILSWLKIWSCFDFECVVFENWKAQINDFLKIVLAQITVMIFIFYALNYNMISYVNGIYEDPKLK